MKKGYDPIHLLCPKCGGAAKYDIADRVYHCAYCGTTTSPGKILDLHKEWRKVCQSRLKKEFEESEAVLYTCPGCGAKVIVKKGEAVGKCSFCDSSLVSKEYTQQDDFPESIIPFKISLDEAKKRLKEWNLKHARIDVKGKLGKHIDDLEGYYLPYQFVRGPLECKVSRDMSDRQYRCGTYVNEIVVNGSRQLKNEVLDGAEPFDFDECRDFNFGYVADHRVKMQDISDAELVSRTNAEVIGDCREMIEKTMHSTGVSIDANHSDLEKLPVLLPMYVISRGDLSVAVNGQNGKIAVSDNKMIDTNRFWFLEPLLTTLFIFLIVWLLSKSFEIAGMFALLVAAISFTAFGQDRESHPVLRVFTSDKKGKKEKQAVPVFREETDEGMVNVEVSFFPLRRILFYGIALPLFNALPLLIAIFFQWSQDLPISDLHFLYLDIWLVISLPFTFIFWTAYLRRDIFDRPIIRKVLPDGRKKRIRVKNQFSIFEVFKDVIRNFDLSDIWAGLLLFGLPILMFVMSVYLIMKG
ncbi:MAG: hypothetical protein IKS54_06550 [Erysipelotrichaceae bacterium]|nr:hypothetical protein [Erysipelotrichaceae bacterium]